MKQIRTEKHISKWEKMFGENNSEAFWVPKILLPFSNASQGILSKFPEIIPHGKSKGLIKDIAIAWYKQQQQKDAFCLTTWTDPA